jgi:K+/H+ antiporter YhaU regulatory subunit KhtT
MISIGTLLVVLTLSILITRIATVALTHTGLSRESAKFQARSAFTGVGFTTSESEKVVSHPVRRRILLTLMLFGNAGVVTAVSTLIVSFVNINRSESLIWQIALLVTGLIALWSLANSSWVDRHLNNFISRMLKSHTNLSVQDFSKLLHLAGDYQISELQVRQRDWLAEKSIAQLGLREEGVIVLGINRTDGTYLGAPDGQTTINKHDVLLLYGRANVIAQLDRRSADSAGDREHNETVIEQKKVEKAEKSKDLQPRHAEKK